MTICAIVSMGYRSSASSAENSPEISSKIEAIGLDERRRVLAPASAVCASDVALREAAISVPAPQTQTMQAIARNSRYLLQRAQTDPHQSQRGWYGAPSSTSVCIVGSMEAVSAAAPVRSIDDAKFSNDFNGSLKRSISDSVVSHPLTINLTSMSIGRGAEIPLEQQASTSTESLGKYPAATPKKCYKRLSSAVSNATIPSIPEQAESNVTAAGLPSSETGGDDTDEYFLQQRNLAESGATSFESMGSESAPLIDPNNEFNLSMPILIRPIDASPASGTIGLRRFRPFVTCVFQQCPTPPSASHYALSSAARRTAFQEQRSSSASTRYAGHVRYADTASISEERLTNASDDSRSRLTQSCVGEEAVLRYRVLEYLHCGRTEVACDGSQLCANRISYLVNLTGFHLPKRRRNTCKCAQTRFHKLQELHDVELTKSLPAAVIFARFEKVNAFIAAARSKGSQILLFDNDSENSQAMALQYIMYYHSISFAYACTHLERHYGARLRLSPFIVRALELWEDKLKSAADTEKNSSDPRGARSNRKIAWS